MNHLEELQLSQKKYYDEQARDLRKPFWLKPLEIFKLAAALVALLIAFIQIESVLLRNEINTLEQQKSEIVKESSRLKALLAYFEAYAILISNREDELIGYLTETPNDPFWHSEAISDSYIVKASSALYSGDYLKAYSFFNKAKEANNDVESKIIDQGISAVLMLQAMESEIGLEDGRPIVFTFSY